MMTVKTDGHLQHN
ncbi:hypothetical protein ECEC1736_0899, partial [Escherichia coli EC1736]